MAYTQAINWTGTPTYTEAPSYMSTAQGMIKTPAQIKAAQKTVLDPNILTKKWDLASTDINDQYMKKGGFYDRMIGDLNERGLATSGERNAQTATMGNDLAKQLAQARSGLEADAMTQQAGFDESYANRLDNTGQFNTTMGYQSNLGQAGLAQQLSGARNELISNDYQAQMAAAAAKQQQENDRLATIASLAGQSDIDTETEAWLAQQLGFPITDYTPDEKIARDRALAGASWTNPVGGMRTRFGQ